MRRGNAGQIGPYRVPASGMLALSELQQSKSGSAYFAEFLLVAGGGGAGQPNPGSDRSGAGGAGGTFVTPIAIQVVKGNSYTVTIGAGGVSGSVSASVGGDSVFGPFTVKGGGAGGSYSGTGGVGGSGAGGGSTSALAGGAGIAGQGYAGGTGTAGGNGGAGGGASGAASGSTPGIGVTSNYSGSSVTYATGGPGSGATGAGSANSGNGGGCFSSQNAGVYAGGSGNFIFRYLGPQRASGGTVNTYTLNGLVYTAHTFTSSGVLTA